MQAADAFEQSIEREPNPIAYSNGGTCSAQNPCKYMIHDLENAGRPPLDPYIIIQ